MGLRLVENRQRLPMSHSRLGWLFGCVVSALLVGIMVVFARHFGVTGVSRALVQSLRAAKVMAPVYVAVASKCAGKLVWDAENDVAAAQRASADLALGSHQGPDLDGTLGVEDRYDGCHLSGHGLMKAAHAWVSVLGRHRINTSSCDWRRPSHGRILLTAIGTL